TTALSGHPIAVIPIGLKKNGMPVGVQIHARKWSDKRLLEIAQHLETFTSGFQVPKMMQAVSQECPLAAAE
ncbi:MAG: amidase family protein, partial [Bacteroidota bacterium]